MNVRQFLRHSALRAPTSPALSDERRSVSYAELDGLADHYTRELGARGIQRGDRIVIWSDKSVEAVAMMQAVLALAAVYVPLDGQSPLLRVASIASRVDAALVVVAAELASTRTGAPFEREWILARDDAGATNSAEAVTPIEDVQVDTLAYILFTSGSTGEPKGVCTSHGNVASFVRWAAAQTELDARDCVANHASFLFDLSVFDLYASFLVGARVVLVPSMSAYVPRSLAALLEQHRVTVLYAVPTAYVLLLEEELLVEPQITLRVALFAGEPFPPLALQRLARALPHARLWNFYGPTETNVCTAYEATGRVSGGPVPIGSAACGDRVYALRDDGALATVGEEGELIVEGPTVMAGYWGQPPLPNKRYATGDLVRVLPDNEFAYLGRRDAMLKVRGYRVEPGEVEFALQASPRVRRVAVIVVDRASGPRLKAFVVPAPGQSLSLLEARRLCAERLPKYMIIDELELVDDLPRTSTGKIARRALATVE